MISRWEIDRNTDINRAVQAAVQEKNNDIERERLRAEAAEAKVRELEAQLARLQERQ